MPERVVFADRALISDAVIFAQRTVRLGDGAVRLQASDGTLAMTSAPLAPRGLLDRTPTVLAMRALSVHPKAECDVVVTASDIVVSADDPLALHIPSNSRRVAWSGVSPPRTGWVPRDGLQSSVLAARAQWGIAAVAEALPASPGEDVVHAVRASIWGEADEALGDLPLGVAFAAFAMGFIVGDETAQVRASGAWMRVTLTRGHVLVRRPNAADRAPSRSASRGQPKAS